MPTPSMFYGIVIRMYFYGRQATPCAPRACRVRRRTGGVRYRRWGMLAGGLPSGKARLVQAWIEIHREELMADWQLAVNGEEMFKIEPLR